MDQREIDKLKDLVEVLIQSDFPEEMISVIIKNKIGLDDDRKAKNEDERKWT